MDKIVSSLDTINKKLKLGRDIAEDPDASPEELRATALGALQLSTDLVSVLEILDAYYAGIVPWSTVARATFQLKEKVQKET